MKNYKRELSNIFSYHLGHLGKKPTHRESKEAGPGFYSDVAAYALVCMRDSNFLRHSIMNQIKRRDRPFLGAKTYLSISNKLGEVSEEFLMKGGRLPTPAEKRAIGKLALFIWSCVKHA